MCVIVIEDKLFSNLYDLVGAEYPRKRNAYMYPMACSGDDNYLSLPSLWPISTPP